jgi:predicted amidohydrolase
MTHRVAIAQIPMRWRTHENVASMLSAMELAESRGARLCAFSELAVTGFHREIAREAVAARVLPAVRRLAERAASLSLGAAFGAPTFGEGGALFNAHLLIDERGRLVAEVRKRGLTAAEATFFAPGESRPIGLMQGLRCSAVICREVSDVEVIAADLPTGAVDLVFVPGALRQDPEKPRTDPPEYVQDIRRLAAATNAYVVQTNWPNALNRPEESVEGGGSTVASPRGEVLFRLPGQAAGVAVFGLGENTFEWYPQ